MTIDQRQDGHQFAGNCDVEAGFTRFSVRLAPHPDHYVAECSIVHVGDPAPLDRSEPFRVSTEFGPNPWNPNTRLLRVGVKAWQAPAEELPAANLVFLLDVSGSMTSAAKLPLLKKPSKRLLISQINGTVSI